MLFPKAKPAGHRFKSSPASHGNSYSMTLMRHKLSFLIGAILISSEGSGNVGARKARGVQNNGQFPEEQTFTPSAMKRQKRSVCHLKSPTFHSSLGTTPLFHMCAFTCLEGLFLAHVVNGYSHP